MRRTACLVGVQVFVTAMALAQATSLPEPPKVRSKNHVLSLSLHAVNKNGHDAFAFHGVTVAPMVRASPGDVLKITYSNDLPANSPETCAISPCMDMTNLHFHGLTVSPKIHQDDVLGMLAKPGQTLRYSVKIPRAQLPGLFWYHTHPHGESHRQVSDGMSGAIVIEGMERYVPEVRGMRERVLIVRGRSTEHDPEAADLRHRVDIAAKGCGGEAEKIEEIFTVNGAVRPQIEIAPNEGQFWRIVNASADRYLDLQIDGQKFEIVALDGMPLAYHDPHHATRSVNHLLVSPAGRLEAMVTGPSPGKNTVLRSLCVDTGPDGDPNPEMVLADVVAHDSSHSSHLPGSDQVSTPYRATDRRPPVYKALDVEPLKKTMPTFTVTFTEDNNGFYINGQKFAMDAPAMTTAHVGTYQHWRIVNDTRELHPFHIHQVHFLAYSENGLPIVNPVWLDTVNVPYRGSIDVILDFTDPVIRGMSVFHCHLLNHEDKGMMAKILFK